MICRHRRGYLGPASLRRGQLGSRFPQERATWFPLPTLCLLFYTGQPDPHRGGQVARKGTKDQSSSGFGQPQVLLGSGCAYQSDGEIIMFTHHPPPSLSHSNIGSTAWAMAAARWFASHCGTTTWWSVSTLAPTLQVCCLTTGHARRQVKLLDDKVLLSVVARLLTCVCYAP